MNARINIIKDSVGILNAFDLHRIEADNATGEVNKITLRDGYTTEVQLDTTASYTALVNQDGECRGLMRNATVKRDQLRAGLVTACSQFIGLMRFYTDVLGNESVLPNIPAALSGRVELSQTCTTVASVWGQVNLMPSGVLVTPVVLSEGLTLAQFQANLVEFNAASNLMMEKRNALGAIRAQRDFMLDYTIKPRLSEYRAKVKIRFPKEHPLRSSLPVLYRYHGSAPEAVVASGVWDTVALDASLQWTACTHAELDHYEVRACSGSVYRTDEDYTIATLPKDQLTFHTSEGLALPGSSMAYKIYAVTKQGRTAGSNTLVVVHAEGKSELAA